MDSTILRTLVMPLMASLEDVQNRITRLEQQITDLYVLSGRVDVLLQQMSQLNTLSGRVDVLLNQMQRPSIHIDNDVSCPTNVAGDMHGDIVRGNQNKSGT